MFSISSSGKKTIIATTNKILIYDYFYTKVLTTIIGGIIDIRGHLSTLSTKQID